MQTTTTATIKAAFITAILGITPTYEPLRSVRWSDTAVQRKGGKAQLMGSQTRNFDLLFGPGLPTYLWFGGGEAYACTLRVATSYSGVEPEHLDHMITADAVDLRRVLSMLRDPTLPGLCDVIASGIQGEQVDSEANVYLEHVFQVHWHQQTETS